jgi:hypothetical protein
MFIHANASSFQPGPVYNPRDGRNSMSDRKYRQRGYRDDDRDRTPRPAVARPAPEPGAPAGARRISQDGPKNINMPGFRHVLRCAQCGHLAPDDIGFNTRCAKCGTELHSCAQCVSFDPSSRFECTQPVPERVSPKSARNGCTFFSPRTTVERETTTPRNNDARKAFDDLFKF